MARDPGTKGVSYAFPFRRSSPRRTVDPVRRVWFLALGPRQASSLHCLDLDQSRSQGVCVYRGRVQGLGQLVCYLVAGSVEQAAVARVQPERSREFRKGVGGLVR
jgi:hypothetical protein